MEDLKLFCNNPALNTLEKFCNFYKIRINDKYTLDDFFEYNRQHIFSQLGMEQKLALATEKGKLTKDLTAEDISVDVELPCPCYLYIHKKYVNYSLAVKNTIFQEQTTSVIAFEDENIRKIVDSSLMKYKGTSRMHPGLRVLGWFKSLYYDGKSGEEENGSDINNIYNSKSNFIDISKFINTLSTTVSEGGGSFTISLPHVPVYNDKGESIQTPAWEAKEMYEKGVNENVSTEQMNSFKGEDGLIIKSDLSSFDYFSWLMSENDLLFISFDDMEEIVDDNISGNIFDMIGLIENVSVSKSADGSYTVNVTGRDLMKLITDDSSIYFPNGVANGQTNVFDNTETCIKGGDFAANQRYKGSEAVNGEIRHFNGLLSVFASEPNDFTIDFVLKTVVSHLANIQIVPDDLFTSWGDKRTTFQTLNPKKEEKKNG